MAIKKTVAFLSIFMIAVLFTGCSQQAAEKPAATQTQSTPQASAQDSTGLDQSAVQQEQQDLSTDELSDIDAGLGEIENI